MFSKKSKKAKAIEAEQKEPYVQKVSYGASFDSSTMRAFHLPIFPAYSPNPDDEPPVYLLGVKGGVGTSTLARTVNDPGKLLDLAEYTKSRHWVTYLDNVILVSNYTYASILALRGVMQQWTSKEAMFNEKIRVLAVAFVDTTGRKRSTKTNNLLNSTIKNTKAFEFPFVPSIFDASIFDNVNIPAHFSETADEMMKYVFTETNS